MRVEQTGPVIHCKIEPLKGERQPEWPCIRDCIEREDERDSKKIYWRLLPDGAF